MNGLDLTDNTQFLGSNTMSTWDCECGRVNEGYEELCTLCGWENPCKKSKWIHHKKRDGSDFTKTEQLSIEKVLEPIHKEVVAELAQEMKMNTIKMNNEFKYRELMFRAWSTKKNEFLATGFHIIGETVMFDLLNQTRIEDLDTLHIQQSTGVKDINGKDIYEGDIVKDNRGWCSVVKWMTTKDGCDFDGWCINGYEVVGNIFETKD